MAFRSVTRKIFNGYNVISVVRINIFKNGQIRQIYKQCRQKSFYVSVDVFYISIHGNVTPVDLYGEYNIFRF